MQEVSLCPEEMEPGLPAGRDSGVAGWVVVAPAPGLKVTAFARAVVRRYHISVAHPVTA